MILQGTNDKPKPVPVRDGSVVSFPTASVPRILMATTATRWLPRIIFALALFGVLVVTHLWLQKEADFAYGCTGAEAITAVDLTAGPEGEAGCAQVTNSAYADFLGVSNIIWGLLFYLGLAGMRLAYAATNNDQVRQASFAFVGAGFLYTLYLVYLQVSVIGAFCVLCMTSAVTVTVLLLLHVMEHRSRRDTPPPRRAVKPVLRPFFAMAAVAAVLLVADVVVAGQRDGAETAATAQASDTPAFSPTVGDTPAAPPTPAVQVDDPAAECTYDPQFAPIADLAPFTDGPYRGNADAPVSVIEFFDPNCPHCKDLHESMREVIATSGDKARFYYVPFALRDNSMGQVAALYLAQQEGKFWDLVEVLFERQDNTWGMTLDEVLSAAEAAGMDAAALRAQLEDEQRIQPLLAEILADRAVAGEAIANAEGGVSVPKLAINNRIVSATYASYSPDCVNYFIDEAYAAAQ